MNINENTDLIGFIVWLICSCNLGQKQILLYHHNSDIQVLQIDIFFFYYIVLVIFFYQLLYDSIFFLKSYYGILSSASLLTLPL